MIYEHLGQLQELVARRKVFCRAHRDLPLAIYNYTPEAMGLKPEEWPQALRDARGLILSDDGEVVGRPFRKFWDAETDKLKHGPLVEITEKMDGSLIIVCSFRGERVVASRGSFYSEQAQQAAAMLRSAWGDLCPDSSLTHLFEVIYPGNRIVLDYGRTKTLVHLTSVDTATGEDVQVKLPVFSPVKRYNWEEVHAIMDDPEERKKHEGFVLRYLDGARIKLKLDEYKRLHRLIFNTSTRSIWEALYTGQDISDYLTNVPKDLSDWVKYHVEAMIQEYQGHMAKTEEMVLALSGLSRKDLAQALQGSIYLHFVSALLDGKTGIKSARNRIWRFIEPKQVQFFRRETDFQ